MVGLKFGDLVICDDVYCFDMTHYFVRKLEDNHCIIYEEGDEAALYDSNTIYTDIFRE